MAERGKFITIEGGEGVGKSTQTQLLVDFLNSKNVQAIATREPGGVPTAEEIRKIILELSENKPLVQLFLFSAARREFISKLVVPQIEAGVTVISDRFADSTVVYQGIVQGLPMEQVKFMQDITIGDLKPDITFVLDIDVKQGLKRVNSRKDKKTFFDEQELEFHQKLRQGFLQVAAENPERVVVIDADKPVDIVHKQIVRVLKDRQFLNDNRTRI